MSVGLLELWLPIVLATVIVWVASGLIHMALKYHNSDYQRLGNEEDVMDVLRDGSPSQGLHAFPHCVDMSEMKDPAVQARYEKGPVGFVLIAPNGMPAMGKLMGLQITHFLIGIALVAYCATLALVPGAPYLEVFRFVMTAGFLAFGWASIPYSIWYGFQWSVTFKYLLDAAIYGALTAGTFAWLWPAGAVG